MPQAYHRIQLPDQGITLRSQGAPATLTFALDDPKDVRASLFVCGETALHYLWKNEPNYPARYRQLEDALNAEQADQAQYCLNLSCDEPLDYIKRLYKKVLWPPQLAYLPLVHAGEAWRFGLHVRTRALDVAPDGFLRMLVEIRLKKEGVHPRSVVHAPNIVHVLDIPEGTCDWTQLVRDITIPADTAHVGVLIEGKGYQGEVFIERPFLTGQGYNLLPDFTTSAPDKQFFDWTAQNLSEKEWPRFVLTLNGHMFFDGAVFERCHRRSEWDVPLPQHLLKAGQNTLEIQLTTRCHAPMPYTLYEVAVLTQPDTGFDLISVPEISVAGQPIPVLLRTDGALDISLQGEGIQWASAPQIHGAGLHVVHLMCAQPALSVPFTLLDGQRKIEASLARVILRGEDGVVTGTGDLIYVPQETRQMADYLSWYMANHVGNLLTIRPTYRWCGTRVANAAVWGPMCGLLNDMGMSYVHMLDGRELPGLDANPPRQWLAGVGFLGRQTHERDGSQFYWGLRHTNGSMEKEQYHDLEHRLCAEQPERANVSALGHNHFHVGNDLRLYRNPDMPRDMRQAHDMQVAHLRRGRGDATRHTGPSVMFKYLFEAGYPWLGAETMYGSMEPLMAFLRGAARSAGQPSIGVHHAVQWSSSPHDTPARYRRYRLALYVSWMQGATEINTEEGLWRIEEYYSYFHRFTEACRNHLKQQQDFYRFVASHQRTGTFHAPMALLHGRYDGWHAFGPNQPWGLYEVKDCDAEKSWDLLRVFYPQSKPGAALYVHGCPEKAVGYHTGTPRGNVDVLPVEGDGSLFEGKTSLAFVGYNCAQAEDLDKLMDYVRAGGTLLLGWAHLSTTTQRAQVEAYDHQYIDHPLAALLGGAPQFRQDTAHGQPIWVNTKVPAAAIVQATSDSGMPLLVRVPHGQGSVVLLNAREYPAHPGVRPVYEQALEQLSDQALARQPVRVICGDDIQYTVFEQPDGSHHLYVLAVDWFRAPEAPRNATLILGGHQHPFTLPFGVMLKIVAQGKLAAWADSEEADVLKLSDKGITVQGTGKVTIRMIRDGHATQKVVDFAQAPVQEIGW